ncbi:MAG: hypothetical protein KJO81_03690 [Gammaproteobacteria bacterium]|nr:hypothetical protein [Gammaproteobacteria bacterium]
MKLAIVKRPLDQITRPDNSPIPGDLVWSTFDFKNREAVYIVQHKLGVEVPIITEWCHKENGKVVCDLTVE